MEQETLTEQPSQDSVQDRIANLLGTDEQPEANPSAPTQETEQTAEETFEFEEGDRKYILPKALEPALQRNKDYTQKTQSLAEQRKDVERQLAHFKLAQQHSAFEQSVSQERKQMEVMDLVLAEYDSLSLKELSPQDAMVKMLERDQLRSRRQALQSQLDSKRAQFEQTSKAEIERLKGEATEALRKRLDWNEKTEAEVRAYVREMGIPDAAYDAVYDPVHKQILWEAAQFRKLKANAQPATQQVKTVKTTSSNPMPQAVKDKFAFNKAVGKTRENSPERRKLLESRAAQIFG